MAETEDPSHELRALRRKVAELEERLERSSFEMCMRGLFDDLFEGIQLVDQEYRYLYVNDTAARQGRRSRDELVGRRMVDVYPGIDTTEMFQRLRRCMIDRAPQQMTNHFEHADGHRAWFELRFRPVAMGVLVLSADISAEKAVAAELRGSKEHLAATLECMTDGVISTGVGGRVRMLNHAAERLTGWSADEARGRELDDVVRILDSQSLERVEQVAERVLHDALRVGTMRGTLLEARDGARTPVACSGAPIRDAAGAIRGVVIALRDVKEEHALTEMLQRAQKMEALGRLAAGVAHDFNNLLTVIAGYSDIVLGRLPANDPSRAPVGQIRKAGEQAAVLTRQLLAFSRQQVMEPAVVDLNAIVTETHAMLERVLGEDIAIATACAPELAGVLADPGKIAQVIMNLAVNSRDAMPIGGRLTIQTANVELDEAYVNAHAEVRPGPYVLLAVSDTGCGMDASTQARIFEPFFTTKEAGKGTGLGLATVFGIVKQSGGHIWLYSEPGHGTTFRIYLPIAGARPPAKRPAVAGKELGGRETILVVEDDDAVREIVVEGLRGFGYHVLEARDGNEAIAIAETHETRIDLLMTDAVMPGLPGRVVAERVAALRPGVRILFVSGYTEDAVVRHGLLDEKVAFLQKPFMPASLARKIRELFAQ
ncbi:MAG: PAS domain S-box protein [Acidobacteria bacterium]|nr:PAS domain S-box protein [Acidobacteriota bacterium]